MELWKMAPRVCLYGVHSHWNVQVGAGREIPLPDCLPLDSSHVKTTFLPRREELIDGVMSAE